MKVIQKGVSLLLVVVSAACAASTPAASTTSSSPTKEQNLVSTQSSTPNPTQISTSPSASAQTPAKEVEMVADIVVANVLSVKATGQSTAYQFAVEISSPDTGCGQYADWWEVLSEDGELLYRRVLLHSHVNEQPFTRSGGPVPVDENTVVIVRAHMNTTGYGGSVLKGSVASGFEAVDLDAGFAAGVETQPPLPEDCAF